MMIISKSAHTVETNYLPEQAGNQFHANYATKYSKEMGTDVESVALQTSKQDFMWITLSQYQKAGLTI